MIGRRLNGVFGAVVAGSLMLSSTAATAATPAPAQVDPWAVLTVMSGGAPAAAMCGSSAAAATAATAAATAQAPGGCILPVADVPPPVPVAQAVPVAGPPPSGEISPLFFALAAIVAGTAAYLFTTGGGQNSVPNIPITPISPA